jgi:tetraacyldisaccharide 4'-kinase
LTVGGVGKTPLVIALAQHFQARGLRVGIVSRGYGAGLTDFPHEVVSHDVANDVGDEPLLIKQKTNATVVIAPKRMDAVDYLLAHHQSQIILSDDGLQHYRMGRAIEIVVIDGQRGLGNQLCLPAGPLREAPSRLKTIDFVIVNSGQWPNAYRMELVPGELQALMSVDNGLKIPLNVGLERNDQHTLDILHQPVAAMAGIGHPQRFFDTLTALNIAYRSYVFPDHHRFTLNDIPTSERWVVMTEKDAVKCRVFAADNMYFLPINATVEHAFWHALWDHPSLKGYQS